MKRNGGKLLFYTNTVDFRLVQIRDICVFLYDHEARVWTVIAAGCDRPLRLKRNVTKETLLKIDDSFVQVSQKHIININYLLEVRDNVCRFYPPFDKIDNVTVGRFFRRKLISRYNSL
ncbi:response regulator receiver domain protein [Prevotella sp. CAG:1058]|nr:response regulator receiver domain protein [Prevotella sp. CAG:1058]